MMNLFNISIDSALIGVGLIEFLLSLASSNIEYSYSIFVLSLLSSRSAVGYCLSPVLDLLLLW